MTVDQVRLRVHVRQWAAAITPPLMFSVTILQVNKLCIDDHGTVYMYIAYITVYVYPLLETGP